MLPFYIDPGTGSMLFSIVIGLVTAGYFLGKAAFIKLKFVLSGGKATHSKNHYPLVIYSEGTRYWNVFKPVLEALEKREVATIFYTSSEDDPFFSNRWNHINGEFIGEGNKAFTRLNFLEADVCLMTTPGLDVYQLKRSKGVKHYSHILHAPSDATTYRLFGLDYYDSILLTGEYQKAHLRILEEQRNIKKKDLVVVGCTYLDVLQNRISALPKPESSDFTVLVAPSWGPSAILSKYGASLLDALVSTGFHIIVRPHPQSRQSEQEVLSALEKRYDSIEWDYRPENLSSLSRADIMISDFSGVVFDYSFLFDRPFMYVNSEFDARPYDSYDIEEEPWIFRILPEIGIELKVEDFPNIKQVLEAAVQSSSLSEKRQEARDIAWQHRGESGERVADYLQMLLDSNSSIE